MSPARVNPAAAPASARRVAARLRSAAACALAVAAAVLLTSGVARADPDQDEIEARMDEIWEAAEPLIEEYNLVHEQYEQNLVRQAELTAQIQPLADELAQAQARIGRIAAAAYMGGQANTFNAMLTAESPHVLVDQLLYLESVSRSQTAQLADVLAIKARYDAAKAPIDVLVAQLAAQDTLLSAQRAEIEARLDVLQEMRTEVLDHSLSTLRPWPCPAEYVPGSPPGYLAAEFACSQIGKPYIFGTSGPNTYDCSGLMLRAWAQVGVYLPHNAAAQRRSISYVEREDLQIGDLVFYYSDLHHVGMYVGDGHIVAAPRANDYVRMREMDRSGTTIHSFGRP